MSRRFPKNSKIPSFELMITQKMKNINQIQQFLEDMYRYIHMRNDKKIKREQDKKQNSRTNVQKFNFGMSDFVLLLQADKKAHKLSFRWIEPQLIMGIKSNFVFPQTRNGCYI